MNAGLPPIVEGEELTARYVLSSRHLRKSEGTVKPDAFVPYPYSNISVTRHLGISETRLWKIGQDVAILRAATLYGRADLQAQDFRRHGLSIEPRPTDDNPNHAEVAGWAIAKSAQKSVAQLLAAKARFVAVPSTSSCSEPAP